MPPRTSKTAPPRSAAGSAASKPGDGLLVRDDGERFCLLSVDFVRGFHFSILEQFGDGARDVLYRSGYEWGLNEMLRLNQQMHDEFGHGKADLWETDAEYVFEAWWAPLQSAGCGTCTFDLSRLDRGVILVELQQSIIAAALAGTDQPVCDFHAGLFAGALSFFARGECHATEVRCRAASHDSCQFIVGPGPEIDAAELARQEGTPVAEIIRRLG